MRRDETIAKIKAALKERSGKAWSVRGGEGTSWGWIYIRALPKRCNQHGHMDESTCKELGLLLALERPAHLQGVRIPASDDYYQEYVDRAEGKTPSVVGEPYWD
jgi:hypothetical protein